MPEKTPRTLKERFDIHEEVCAERYASMQRQLMRVEWVVYGVGAFVLALAAKTALGF